MNWDYIAGFYEGEGYCQCRKFRNIYGNIQHELQLTICQKEKIILEKIKKYVGFGNLWINKKTGITYLSMASRQARTFLRKILPFCNSPYKIEQINKALRLDRDFVGTPGGWRERKVRV